MTEGHTLVALAAAIALTMLAAIAAAVVTGRSIASKIGRGLAVIGVIGTILFLAWPRGSPPPARVVAPTPNGDRLRVEVAPGRLIGVPRALLSLLLKDLGTDEFLPKTVDSLAHQLTTERLSLVDPRSARQGRRFPPDAEFYWLVGPAGFCGSGGCSTQLYWVSPSSAEAGRIFPIAKQEDAASFNKSPTVLTRSTNGLFDVSLSQATGQPDGDHEPDIILTFNGQQYVVSSAP